MAESSAGSAAVQAIEVSRTYRAGRVRGLAGVSLTGESGEVVAVMGPSGSGKSTLLQVLGGLDDPDEGRALVTGVDWRTLHGRARARFRRRTCGFITQSMSLLTPAPDGRGAGERGPRRQPGETARPALRRAAAAGCHRPRTRDRPRRAARRR